MDFEEISEMRDAPKFFAMYKSLGCSADEVEYRRRLESFFLHTGMSALGYIPEHCGLPPTATQDEKGFRFYASRGEAQQAQQAAGIGALDPITVLLKLSPSEAVQLLRVAVASY